MTSIEWIIILILTFFCGIIYEQVRSGKVGE